MWKILLQVDFLVCHVSVSVWFKLSLSVVLTAVAMLCKEQGITVIAVCCVFELVIVHKVSNYELINSFAHFYLTLKKYRLQFSISTYIYDSFIFWRRLGGADGLCQWSPIQLLTTTCVCSVLIVIIMIIISVYWWQLTYCNRLITMNE